jgi:tetratricopeptide (TPR) repeat protein
MRSPVPNWIDRLRKISVSNSGKATATGGGYANTGVHIGDVNLHTGAPVQTRYLQQVRRIAPQELIGRGQELAELAEFCTSPSTAGTYAWWRASAWTGKSALMSWFVLNPPPGVRLVSFFVTARLASQNDRAAFVDNVMEQLLALLGEGLPPFLTESTREGHMLGLLAQAAELCRERDEAFVLLVDGLDEDRGTNKLGQSIAGLLPAEPPAGLRVIVAGRPNPPISGDVSEGHPLHSGTIVRSLAASPQAQAMRLAMEEDLTRLLDGSPAEQDLLGLVASAGGGLSAADLADLNGMSTWQVNSHLRTVAGRSFALRGSHYAPDDAPDVFLLGHEELQVTALEMLGSRVAGYRQRLHDWFRRYQSLGWPADTPEYLLRGYFNMVHATGDLPAMVACATDPVRQDRMLDISGGDVAALAEIVTSIDVAAKDPPDLVAMVRLAMHRDHLQNRNNKIPSMLPEVWAMLGQFNRAEAMANSITNRDIREWALVPVGAAMAESGRLDQAENLALSLTDLGAQATTLAAVAKAAAARGDHARAVRLVEVVATGDESEREHKLNSLPIAAEAAAQVGRLDRAVGLLDDVAGIVRGPDFLPDNWVRAIVVVSGALAAAGANDRARRLSAQVWQAVHDSSDRYARQRLLSSAAEGAAAIADLPATLAFIDEAEALLSVAELPYQHTDAVAQLAKAAAAAGALDRAATLLDKLEALAPARDGASRQARIAIDAVEIAAALGDRSRAVAFLDQVVDFVAAEDDSEWQADLTADAARCAVIIGDLSRARALAAQSAAAARAAVDVPRKASALGVVAEAAAVVGDQCANDWLRRAEAAAQEINSYVDRLGAMAQVTKTAALAGDVDRAGEFFSGVEKLIVRGDQSWLFEMAIEVMVGTGDLERAAQLLTRAEEVLSTGHDDNRVRGLAALARAAVVSGMLAHATTLADELEELVPGMHQESQWEGLAGAAVVRAATGQPHRGTALLDRAEERALSIGNDYGRDAALGAVAVAAGIVDADRVDRLVHDIASPHGQALVLAQTAKYRSPDRQARVIAQALRLSDWYIPVRPLVELVPAALQAIIAELEIVQR